MRDGGKGAERRFCCENPIWNPRDSRLYVMRLMYPEISAGGGFMGQKDMVEKIMEDYPDVFADIVNVLLFDGKQVILEEDLKETGMRSQFKADTGRIHEEERDVGKYWIRDGVIQAMIGLENQSQPDGVMPMRIIGYDGASYKSQLAGREDHQRYPVITLVLYFGGKRWSGNRRSLWELFAEENNPAHKNGKPTHREISHFAEDYHMRLFEIAYLSEKQLKMFRSDFGLLAEYMVRKRKNEPFRIPQDRQIRHVDAFLKMLSVFADEKYVEECAKSLVERSRKGERIMGCDISAAWADLGRKEGRQEGLLTGRKEGLLTGRREGQEEMSRLITAMVADGRIEELERSARDSEFREKMLKEYHLV